MDKNIITTQVIVIGSGPGGYTAAFRAADLGLKVIIIEKDDFLGGVCLNRGCIPSKALLHISEIIDTSKHSENIGIKFNSPKIDIKKINKWKKQVVDSLSSGINMLSKKRNIDIINGRASFLSANMVSVRDNQNKTIKINFESCIIATGSKAIMLDHLYNNNSNIIGSKEALELNKIPKKMLIIGGGYIGLELGSVYNSLGTNITIAEFFPNLLSMADQDLVEVLYKKLDSEFADIYLSTEVTKLESKNNKVTATLKNNNKKIIETFDCVLVCVGRTPNTSALSLDKAGISLTKRGFIPVNKKMRTNIPNIYAIGDVVGNPMLAHKATHEAKIAAENIAGHKSYFEPTSIPSVIYTNPEIAWVGFTENELKDKNIEYNKGVFPWNANGRALTMGENNGKTKILSSKDNNKILGIGIVGKNAGELINEGILAIEMGTSIEDLCLTIHAHPTLGESISNAAEIINKTVTDLYIPK